MPIIITNKDGHEETVSDSFTRLSIPYCEADDGQRPIDPAWPDADKKWLSPAFEFSPTYPLVAGRQTTINLLVRNLGTREATNVLVEIVYTIFIGDDSEGWQTIENQVVPVIPAGGEVVLQTRWTPPNTQATHGCLRARALDVYSMETASDTIFEWDPYINRRAAQRNVRLVPIAARRLRPIAIPFLAQNFTDRDTDDIELIVTRLDRRERFRNPSARFPVPMPLEALLTTPDEIVSHAATPHARTVVGSNLREVARARLASSPGSVMWPRPAVDPALVHQRFGFAQENNFLRGHARRTFDPVVVSRADFRRARVRSQRMLHLRARQRKELYFLVPPEEMPGSGRRAVFQVSYRFEDRDPVQHTIYMSR